MTKGQQNPWPPTTPNPYQTLQNLQEPIDSLKYKLKQIALKLDIKTNANTIEALTNDIYNNINNAKITKPDPGEVYG